jgi:hypothetical protein
MGEGELVNIGFFTRPNLGASVGWKVMKYVVRSWDRSFLKNSSLLPAADKIPP